MTPCIAYKSLGFLGKLSSLVKRYFPYQTIRLQNQSHVKSDIKKLGDFWKKLWLLAFCAPCSNEYFFVAICRWAPKIKIVFSRSQPMTAQQISINFRPVKSLFERCVEGQNFVMLLYDRKHLFTCLDGFVGYSFYSFGFLLSSLCGTYLPSNSTLLLE